MRARLLKVLLMSFLAVSTLVSSGQVSREQSPGFALSIQTENGWPENQYWIDVKKTIVSFSMVTVDECMPLEYRRGFKIDVAHNGVPLRMNASSPTVQFLQQLREVPVPRERSTPGCSFRIGYTAGHSFNDSVPVSEFFDMSQPGDYEVTVSEETNPDDPATSATVKSNTITTTVLRQVVPVPLGPSAEQKSFALCLPPGLTPDDLVDVHLTTGQKLSELKAYCTAQDILTDGTGKPITFYRLTGCWGNAPIGYDAILKKQQNEIDALKRSYDVIEMSCNPSGIPRP